MDLCLLKECEMLKMTFQGRWKLSLQGRILVKVNGLLLFPTMKYFSGFCLSLQIITWQQKFLLYLYATYDIHTPLISRSWTGYIISTSLDKAEQIHGRVGRKKTMSKGTGNESRIFSCHIDITFIIHWKCWKFDTNSVLFNINLTRLEYLGNSS